MAFFGLWKPKCPIDYREKAWVESRMSWLGEQFGEKRLIECRVIFPPELRFAETFDGSPDAARRLLDLLCRLMAVDPGEIKLEIALQDDMTGRVGEYESGKNCGGDCDCKKEANTSCPSCEPPGPGVIRIVETQLENPVALTATLAHELAHHLLIGRGLLDGESDMEWTTDLTPVIFGLGIFAANATIQEKSAQYGQWHHWSIRRQGYLPSRMLGYALALHEWLSEESSAGVIECLRQDAADAFGKGLDYLRSTEDSLLQPENVHVDNPNPSLRQLIASLEDGSLQEKVIALWKLVKLGEQAGEAAPYVADLLTSRRPGIRAEAARTLARLGPSAEMAVPVLLDAMSDPTLEIRATATYAVGRLHAQSELAVQELVERLNDSEIVETVAWALAQYGNSAATALPPLKKTLITALGRNDKSIDYLTYAVCAISPSPEEEMREVIASCDAELQQQIHGLLPEGEGHVPDPPGGKDWWYWTGGQV